MCSSHYVGEQPRRTKKFEEDKHFILIRFFYIIKHKEHHKLDFC